MVVHYQITGRTGAEISASVEEGVRVGALAAGESLPAVRALAGSIGVSPATVAGAYRSLRDRGLVETAGRGGTRVRSRPPVAVRAGRRPAVPSGVVDLSSGGPAERLLPPLGPALRRVAADGAGSGYDRAGPLPALLDLAWRRLAADGVLTTAARAGGPEDAPLTITAGALDGIERALGAYLRPGDKVAVEDPGWANLLDLVAALGLVAVPVAVDDAGPTAEGLAAAVSAGVRAVIITCRAQNPSGARVSADRALALGRLLAPYPGILVVEDDHAAELSATPPNHVDHAAGAWAFVRSVSKPYGPDLRLAVLAGDDTTVARIEGRMRLGTGWVSTLLQRLVVELWTDPGVAETVAAAGVEYTRLREGLLTRLAGRGIAGTGVSGINVWIPVADETAVVARMRDSGYAVAPGARFRIASPAGVRVTVSTLDERALDQVADAIAFAVDPPGDPRGATR